MIRRMIPRSLSWLVLSTALAVFLAPAVVAQDAAPAVLGNDSPAIGSILTDASGWTLYTFAPDGPEMSTCVDQCALVWPPLTGDDGTVGAPDLPGALTVFSRDDGTMQVAYDQAPLYYYSGDMQRGDTNGQGIGGRWFAAMSGLAPATQSPPVVAPNPQAPSGPPPAQPTSRPALPTARPTPPTTSAQPTSAPAAAPTSAPAPTPVPYSPPHRMY